MPTVLDIMDVPIPHEVGGRSLLPIVTEPGFAGREYVISTLPFANPDETTRTFDHLARKFHASPVTTVTAGRWSLLDSMDAGTSTLHDLEADPVQERDVIGEHPDIARELHGHLVAFLRETEVPERLLAPRLHLDV